MLRTVVFDHRLEFLCLLVGKTKARGGAGKTDRIDAELGARGILHMRIDQLIQPRTGDTRKIIRTLLSSREILVRQHTMEKNALTALLRGVDLGIDARQKRFSILTIRDIASSRSRCMDAPYEAVTRAEAKRLASSIAGRVSLLKANERALTENINQLAPGFLGTFGLGAVSAAKILCAYSHKGRINSPAAFCSLAGVAPIPASSGNVIRHRLNRYGDRVLNNALDIIVKIRIKTDPTTQQYVQKRISTDLSHREIRRTLKRYVARSIFKQSETFNIAVD